jgi:hypothetical protein
MATESTPPARPVQEVGSGRSRRGRPIELGGALVTLVEPHRGHEVAYNRWYERDHFYAGCMIGAWTISGARFVATRDLKDRRRPADSPVTGGDPLAGSYLSLYWVLDGKFGDWIEWGTRQVRWLIESDRMFPHRDHVHTVMYRFRAELPGRDDGVPVELALDHRSPWLVMAVGEIDPAADRAAIEAWLAARTPGRAEVGALFTPVPMPSDAPSDVPADSGGDRFLALWFVDADLPSAWDEQWSAFGADLVGAGLGQLLFLAPFRATVPGTDAFADELR